MNSLDQWLEWITSIHPKTIELSLERIKKVAARLFIQSFNCPVITVGGTNGKGSCVAFLSTIYHTAGYRVATYTSPHLLRFNERICINQKPVDDNTLCNAFEEVKTALQDTSLTFFEFTTLAAFLIFKRADLDVIILEVGLGGRLDAVNIIDADVAIVSTVALDHMDYLGPTREHIGFEKSGIFRASKPAVCGDPYPPTSLIQHAQLIHAPLYCQHQDFHYAVHKDYWTWQSLTLPLPLLPIQNASTSLMAIELFQNKLPVSQEAIQNGLIKTRLVGRYQVITNNPRCIVDVAHNPEATRYLCQKLALEPCLGKTHALVAMRQDKAVPQALIEMLPVVDQWHLASLSIENGAKSAFLGQLLSPYTKFLHCYSSPQQALHQLLSKIPAHDRIVVFGSFHTVQAILEERDFTKN